MTILRKTWSLLYNARAIPTVPYSRNNDVTGQEFLLLLKNGLVNGPSPWTVIASSNRVVADTNDNWNAVSDIVKGEGNGGNDTWPASWIILRSSSNPVIYLLMDCTTTSVHSCTLRWSEAQPDISDLSINRVPEATGPEINKLWYPSGPGSGQYEYYVTMLAATDGSFMYIGTTDAIGDDDFLMLNFLRDTSPLDLHPYVVQFDTDYNQRDVFEEPHKSSNNSVFSFAPDGTALECSLASPGMIRNSSDYTYIDPIAYYASDDLSRNYRPWSFPIRVLTRTSGYKGFKGYLEDFWWGAKESVTGSNMRWMQSGFEGQNAVVCRRGCWWMPAPEPFRW